jgi:hypothetical protein
MAQPMMGLPFVDIHILCVGKRVNLILEMVHGIASLKNLTPFSKGFPHEKKDA